MAPLLFLRPKYIKNTFPTLVGAFVLLTIFMMVSPSSWISFVDNIITSFDTFSSYEIYLEEQSKIQFKGITLIIISYWVYLLARQTNNNNLNGSEYLVMKMALVRIAFDLLPAVGMSTRFFYYIDAYFFAGMMVVLSRLPKNDVNKWILAISLLIMFWYSGYRPYMMREECIAIWGTYNFYF